MKKIAFIHPVDDLYGASNILAYILSVIPDDIDCELFVPENKGSVASKSNRIGTLTVTELPFLPIAHKAAFTPLGLLKWINQNFRTYCYFRKRREEFSLIYINTVALFGLLPIFHILKLKTLLHCHEYLKGSFVGSIIKKTTSIFGHRVISVSAHVNSYIRSSNAKVQYEVIHNGIPDLCETASPNIELMSSKKLKVAFVARIMPEKGHWFLLETLKKMNPVLLKKMEVNVIGDPPPLRSELLIKFKNDVDKFGLKNTVKVRGFDSDITKWLSKSHVSVVPSIMADPFPTTVLESMMSSKACIATNHGGAKEILKEGYSGFLISPNNTDEFETALKYCIENREKVIELGLNAREHYSGYLTIQQFQSRFLKVLLEAIED